MAGTFRTGFLVGCGGLWLVACGGDPSVDAGGPGDEEGGSSSAEGGRASGGVVAVGGSSTGGINVGVGGASSGGASSGGQGGGVSEDPCESAECGEGQRCEVADDAAMCIDNECADLECTDTEECQPAPESGNRCVSIACGSDVDCPLSRFCNDALICVDDVCEAGTRRCEATGVVICASNGGEETQPYMCDSAGYYESLCSDTDPARTGCGCEDDWDCPAFTTCETGLCVGTGVAPTCTLPPPAFADVLPQLEFRWGGTNRGDPEAVDAMGTEKAFAWSAQVVSPPIVINLDDDNGDGNVNELDFPEIVFITHLEDERDDNGVVRAVHGGGPNKGLDFFALCGDPSINEGVRWLEGEPVVRDCDPNNGGEQSSGAGIVRPSGGLAAGDIDGDGLPEIVVATEGEGFLLLNNRGAVLLRSPGGLWTTGDGEFFVAPAPAIANLDLQGLAEIVVGNSVVTLTKTADIWAIDRVFNGAAQRGLQVDPGFLTGPVVCVADLSADPGLEIVAGTTAYRLPAAPPAGCGAADNPCPLDVVWNAADVGGNALAQEQLDGFCAVADVLGEDPAAAPGPENPLDGTPEVVLVADGHLVILEGATGVVRRDLDLAGGIGGGAPNVDDFDGDGFPEIATALSDFYSVIDLQEPTTECPAWPTTLDARGAPPQGNPARAAGGACATDADCTTAGTVCNEIAETCVCLHNGWKRDTEDDSSRVTSSSVFDFNGDGASEVVYNDECYFRVYDGAAGSVYLALPSLSRTIIENPLVADVDNDGNAEIIFVTNNDIQQCNEGDADEDDEWDPEDSLDGWPDGEDNVPKVSLPNGIEVWGDPSDVWVAARRVWNQHSYHVTNVLESGGIPLHEPESWLPLNGRVYNTYRSQPRVYGVAPDLTLVAIQVSSPDVACGELSDEVTVTVLVRNDGDLRVGPGVVVEFFGTWEDGVEEPLLDAAGNPLTVTLGVSLEPGAATQVSVSYQVGNNDPPHDEVLPSSVRATIDGGNDSMASAERECREDNNEVESPVDPGEALADLELSIESGTCSGRIEVTVTNNGSTAAGDVLVRIYAGDPSAGGSVLGEDTIAGPIEPGESVTVAISVGALDRNLTIWGIADPLDTVPECNDANNVAEGPRLECEEDVPE